MRRIVAVAACVALSTGCFAYTKSQKRSAYVLDSLFIAGGGSLIAYDQLRTQEMCMSAFCAEEVGPVSATMVVGTMLVTGGLVGILLNATRPESKPR